jgi:hypothetical protein
MRENSEPNAHVFMFECNKNKEKGSNFIYKPFLVLDFQLHERETKKQRHRCRCLFLYSLE